MGHIKNYQNQYVETRCGTSVCTELTLNIDFQKTDVECQISQNQYLT